MADPTRRDPNGNPVVTVIVILVVGFAAAFTFKELHRETTRPEASGAGGVGVDAATNHANHP